MRFLCKCNNILVFVGLFVPFAGIHACYLGERLCNDARVRQGIAQKPAWRKLCQKGYCAITFSDYFIRMA